MVNQQLSTNTFTTAKWIVSPTASDGTHTTIAAALTAASSGDTIFIRPGIYTENPTLKAGVNLSAYICDAFTPNVTISGKCTFTGSGIVSISGIRLQTNNDFLLAVTGSSASVVKLINCYFDITNHTAISYTSSSASSQINMLAHKSKRTVPKHGTRKKAAFEKNLETVTNSEYEPARFCVFDDRFHHG